MKRPNRLDLRYEKSYTLAILRNNATLITSFPEKSLKTVNVCMTQVKDYKKYKDDKSNSNGSEMITTPFHLACRLSNDEAVR